MLTAMRSSLRHRVLLNKAWVCLDKRHEMSMCFPGNPEHTDRLHELVLFGAVTSSGVNLGSEVEKRTRRRVY